MKFLTLAAGALALAAITAGPAQATGTYHGSTAATVVQVTYGHQSSVRSILWNLRQRGFHDFRDIDRWGHVYKIIARYRGKLVRITVNAYNGRVVDVDPIRYHHNGWSHGSHGGHGGHGWSWTLRF